MLNKLAWGAGIVFGVLFLIESLDVPSSSVTGLLVPADTSVARAVSQSDITIVDVLNAPRNAAPPILPAPSDYAAYCTEQWTKRGVLDSHMRDYCISRERDGYAKLRDTIDRYHGYFWLAAVLTTAEDKWTKRGIRRDSMVAYELERQIDGFLDLQYVARQGNLDIRAGTACLNEWTKNSSPDWTMTEYCYKRKIGRD